MRIYLSIALLITSLSAWSQSWRYFLEEPLLPKRSEADSIIFYLNIHNRVYGAVIGDGGIPVLNYKKFEHYATHYPIDSLLEFTGKDYMLSLRVYSGWALLRRNYTGFETACESLLKDTTLISFSFGCTVDWHPINQFIYELMAGHIDRSFKKWPKEKLIALRNKYHITPEYKDDF